MKPLIAILAIVLSLPIVSAYADPELKLLSDEWDFGRVEQGRLKSKVFSIKNQGCETLVIGKIHSCCGYSVKEISSWQLDPGEKASIEVVCNALHKMPGPDAKSITILSNSAKNPQLNIPVTAYIIGQETVSSGAGRARKTPKADSKSGRDAELPSLTADEVNARIHKGLQVIMFDVRERSEYEHKYIPNSIRFARSKLNKGDRGLEDLLRNVSKHDTIVVFCASGVRSSYVTSRLRRLGYKAYNLEGGISDWAAKGYALVIGPAPAPSEEGIPVDLEEAYEYYYLLFNNNTQWIDVRSGDTYKKGHIKGALNIPVYEIEKNLDSIPRSQNLILYCHSPGCGTSSVAARKLIKNGFKKGLVRVFSGGFQEWEEAAYPVEKQRL